ncbi:hypothetical protein [Novosphingobium pituita]|uniref:Uncharacterized protein n=1 Tax=Novosphingobium pituita TaxID=3056842 RepID=A0ABQ6PD15_9SPHN|nr:hypothetical protein [Novosphingobium sp. IK01]GMM62474.1 hypothetical protein NUTIK01_32510 [Novosphingobium sp. IK01]
MKRELILGIAVTSLAASAAQAAEAASAATTTASPAAHGGGKCASGKCGTEKIYAQTKLKQDPSGQLVRARDGQCGLSGKGYKVAQTSQDRLAEGVCGR